MQYDVSLPYIPTAALVLTHGLLLRKFSERWLYGWCIFHFIFRVISLQGLSNISIFHFGFAISHRLAECP